MLEDETIELLRKISQDLDTIKRYTSFQARDAMIAVLNKIASTPERQHMWRLSDGNHSNDQIASEIGVTVRSVQYFVGDAQNAGLLTMEKRGYPKRIEDIFPSEWKPWRPKKNQEEMRPESFDKTETTEGKPIVKS